MTDPTRPDASSTDPGTGTQDDLADLTHRHEVPPAAPITPSVERYSPQAEPRPEWSRAAEPLTPSTPERWYEPAPAIASTTPVPPTATSGARRGGVDRRLRRARHTGGRHRAGLQLAQHLFPDLAVRADVVEPRNIKGEVLRGPPLVVTTDAVLIQERALG